MQEPKFLKPLFVFIIFVTSVLFAKGSCFNYFSNSDPQGAYNFRSTLEASIEESITKMNETSLIFSGHLLLQAKLKIQGQLKILPLHLLKNRAISLVEIIANENREFLEDFLKIAFSNTDALDFYDLSKPNPLSIRAERYEHFINASALYFVFGEIALRLNRSFESFNLEYNTPGLKTLKVEILE